MVELRFLRKPEKMDNTLRLFFLLSDWAWWMDDNWLKGGEKNTRGSFFGCVSSSTQSHAVAFTEHGCASGGTLAEDRQGRRLLKHCGRYRLLRTVFFSTLEHDRCPAANFRRYSPALFCYPSSSCLFNRAWMRASTKTFPPVRNQATAESLHYFLFPSWLSQIVTLKTTCGEGS